MDDHGLLADLRALDDFGRDDAGGFTRLAWSPELHAVTEWAAGRMRDAGLETVIDAAGNLIGRWPGKQAEGKAVLIASHLDTVTSGGRYDGALGVLTGLEAIRRLRAEGFDPARPIWLASFMDEEGERFSSAMIGSRALVGEPIPAEEADRRDSQGVTVAEAMRSWDREFSALPEAACIDDIGCYVELHCELGPVLEREGIDIGAVTEIVGLVGLTVTLEGVTNHAGTTPMVGRRDSLVGASRVVMELRDRAVESGAFLATVGGIHAHPGGVNAVPGSCTFTVDLRASTPAGMEIARETLARALAAACEAEGLSSSVHQEYELQPMPLDAEIVEATCQAAAAEGLSYRRMPSGAAHDAMILAPHVPAGMLFVPSVDGIGHAPEETTHDADVLRGAAVLTRVVRTLAT